MAIIEGRNPVIEALKSGAEIEKILICNDEGSIKKIISMAKDARIPVEHIEKSRLNEMATTPSHQGVVALIAETVYASVEDILQFAKDKNEKPFIVILDEICDPHNLGAIIRTANGAGVHGVIIPKRRSVGVNATVAKTSAGAINYTKVAKVSNLAQTIEKLKEEGIWFYATHQDAKTTYTKVDYSGGVGLVIGSEGFGVGELIAKKCDMLVSIPMLGEINSLNASVAAGILMYEIVRQKGVENK